MTNRAENKILDPTTFINQLNLMVISNEFKNTCKFHIQQASQSQMIAQNLVSALAVVMKNYNLKNLTITPEKAEMMKEHVVDINILKNGNLQVNLIHDKKNNSKLEVVN